MNSVTSQDSPFNVALTVVVVCADSGPALRDCVRSVLAAKVPLQLILIDNDSHDGMPEAIARAHVQDPRLKVLYNYRNLGFGPAVNVAAAKATGDALLILNPDCIAHEGDLTQLLAVLNDHPKAGLIGAVVCDAQGQVDPASRRRDPLLRRSLNTLFRRSGERVEVDGEIPAQLIEAEAVSGAVMLMPRLLFERMGGFDENYFLHCEDLDLCRRVRDRGYQVLLAGHVRIHHGKGSSSRHRPVFVSRHKHRGMWRWFRTHDPVAKSRIVSALVWLGIWAHFLIGIPAQLWALMRLKRQTVEPGAGDER